MKHEQFSISIEAPQQRVWEVLWSDNTFRDWANLIDEGTYMKGELLLNGEVQYISASSGYGVTNKIIELVPHERIVLEQIQDTKDHGESSRADEWTGGMETYELIDKNGATTLTLTTDIPQSLEVVMRERLPNALARIKALAEGAL